jgi:hypothetical protein
MLGLLAVVALASRGAGPSGGDAVERSPTAAFWDYVYTGTIVVMAVGVVVLVFALVAGREGLVEARHTRGNQALAGIIFFFLVLGILAGVRLLRGDGLNLPRPPTATAPTSTDGLGDTGDANRPREPEFQWAPVVALGLAGGGTAAYFVVRRRLARTRLGGDDTLAEELADVLDDTLDDLLAEPDPRRAVIAAYARMERALAAHGVPRRESEAPLEYLERASGSVQAGHPAAMRLLFELTHLFERAKFSAHEVDRTMRDDAIDTLTALRAELRGGAL